MKHDTTMELVKDIPVAAGTTATAVITLNDWSIITAIVVGALTAIYTAVRIAHALRKWYLEEVKEPS